MRSSITTRRRVTDADVGFIVSSTGRRVFDRNQVCELPPISVIVSSINAPIALSGVSRTD